MPFKKERDWADKPDPELTLGTEGPVESDAAQAAPNKSDDEQAKPKAAVAPEASEASEDITSRTSPEPSEKKSKRRFGSSAFDDLMILAAVAAFVTLAVAFGTVKSFLTPDKEPAMDEATIVELDRLEQAYAAYQKGDFETARTLWQVGAKEGTATAQFNLGLIYAEGRGVVRNPEAAVRWWRLAADKGHDGAQYNLGLALLGAETSMPGQMVEPDYEEAKRWLHASAKSHMPEAQFFLGRLLVEGSAEEGSEGITLLSDAADAGHNEAKFVLAECFLEGRVVDQNNRDGLTLLIEAAQSDYGPAQDRLGDLYLRGGLVKKDLVEALAWSTLAGQSGITPALERRQRLIDALEDDDIALAHHRMAELAGS